MADGFSAGAALPARSSSPLGNIESDGPIDPNRITSIDDAYTRLRALYPRADIPKVEKQIGKIQRFLSSIRELLNSESKLKRSANSADALQILRSLYKGDPSEGTDFYYVIRYIEEYMKKAYLNNVASKFGGRRTRKQKQKQKQKKVKRSYRKK